MPGIAGIDEAHLRVRFGAEFRRGPENNFDFDETWA
jgi:hypothetical protein